MLPASKLLLRMLIRHTLLIRMLQPCMLMFGMLLPPYVEPILVGFIPAGQNTYVGRQVDRPGHFSCQWCFEIAHGTVAHDQESGFAPV